MSLISKPLDAEVTALQHDTVRINEVCPIVMDGTDVAPARIGKYMYVILRNSVIDGRPDGFYQSQYIITAGETVVAGHLLPTSVGEEIKKRADEITALNIKSFDLGNNMSIKKESTTITLPSDGVYLLVAYGSNSGLASCVYFIGGYYSASRCKVTSLVSTVSGFTIDSSDTTALTFTLTNTSTARLYISYYKLI